MPPPPRLTTAPIGPTLFHMSWPMTLGILANMFFNVVDTFFVSRLGEKPLAAMAFTFPLVFFVTGSCMGMSIGVSSCVSRAIGAGEEGRVKRLTTNSVLMAAGTVILLTLILLPLMNPILKVMGAEPELLPLIKSYMIPWACGIVFLVTPMIGNSAIRASGDSLTPSLVMLCAGALNVILDPLLIFGIGPFPRLELAGAAIATVIAYVGVCILMLLLMRFKYHLLTLRLGGIKRMLANAWEVLEIGLPATFTNQMIPVANGLLTALVAKQGVEAVAAWGVGTRLESLMMSPFFAMSTVMAPIVGQNLGAGRIDRIQQAIKSSAKASLLISLVIWLLAALTSKHIAALFSDNAEIRSLIQLYLWIVPCAYGFFSIKLQIASSFNGSRRPLYSTAIFLSRFFLFMIPCAFVGEQYYGLPGFFAGIALGNLFSSILAVSLWKLRPLKAPKLQS